MILPSNLDKLSGLFPSVGPSTPAAAAADKTQNGTSPGHELTTDTTQVSSAGSQLLNSIKNASPDLDVRTDKVAAVAAAIKSGTYSVPADAVARKLIDSMAQPGK